jgi:hypothetical protein
MKSCGACRENIDHLNLWDNSYFYIDKVSDYPFLYSPYNNLTNGQVYDPRGKPFSATLCLSLSTRSLSSSLSLYLALSPLLSVEYKRCSRYFKVIIQ